MPLVRKYFTAFVLIIFLFFCSGWGFLAHKTAQQAAIYQLPQQLRNFFFVNAGYMVYNSVRPDMRRGNDSTEGTKHFIDLEVFGDSAAYHMPTNWKSAVQKYSADTLLKYGYVPYHIIAVQQKLTNAFKIRQTDSILFYAADLGHYIQDATVPLHTTINYDGQLTNQHGIHALWETVVPEIELSSYNLYTKHNAKYIRYREAAVWDAIRKAHKLLPDVLAKEKQVSMRFTDSTKYRIQMKNGREVKYYTASFAKAYAEALGSSINKQLMYASGLTADFWYTAWVDAGKPDLDKLPAAVINNTNKTKLKTEMQSFRKNRLVQDSLLRALKKG